MACCLHVSSLYSQDESSEEIIGEWMEQRGIRDQIVVATKVSSMLVIQNMLESLTTRNSSRPTSSVVQI